MTRQMSPELDAWVRARTEAEREITLAAEVWRENHSKSDPRRTSPNWTRTVEFSDDEWRFLWSRFQPVGTPCYGFARRLQTSATDVMSFTAEQRCWALALAFKYRRKVLFNPRAGALNEEQFVAGIRKLSATKTTTHP